MNEHPSELALEKHLLDPARSVVASHLESCDRCRARVTRMEQEGEHFRQFVLPATLDDVVDRHSRRREKWLAFAAIVPALAAAALLIVVRIDHGPGEDYVGAKGGLALAAFASSGGGVEAVRDGSQVPASAALRFRVQPANPCSLWLVSVDETGHISRIYPPTGETGATVAQPGALPGGAVLDGKPGLERFYAICSKEPLPFARVEASVKSTAAGGADALRRGDPLRDLPRASSQATLLVEKR